MKSISLSFVLIISIVISCIIGVNVSFANNKLLKIWALSDIQPRDSKDKEWFENAVEDINHNIGDIDFVIVAGDIVNRAEEKTFLWYESVKKNSYIDEWYEIAGNHDLKTDNGTLYKSYINNNFHYKIEKDNILILLMSDEKRGKPTDISDDTFSWWKSSVESGQDKIIFVVTHAPLKGSLIPFSAFSGRHITDSYRFRDILKHNIVDVWLSGHLHIPHSIKNNIVINQELNNTTFLNISSIRPELMGLKDSESFIVELRCGYDMVIFRSRNHAKRKYNDGLQYVHRLSKPYNCHLMDKIQ